MATVGVKGLRIMQTTTTIIVIANRVSEYSFLTGEVI